MSCSMMIIQRRHREGFLDRPTQPHDTAVERALPHAEFFCPTTQGLSPTVEGNQAHTSRIGHLLRSGGPSDVARFVMTVIVWPSVNRMAAGWSRADVREECTERTIPERIDEDPTSSIIGKRFQSGIRASRAHGLPHVIFGKMDNRLLFLFDDVCQSCGALLTAAGCRMAILQIVETADRLLATLTTTADMLSAVLHANAFDDRESTEICSRVNSRPHRHLDSITHYVAVEGVT